MDLLTMNQNNTFIVYLVATVYAILYGILRTVFLPNKDLTKSKNEDDDDNDNTGGFEHVIYADIPRAEFSVNSNGY
jgi:phosphotransferase system  glucose/maltose/N-acetylglucosamine-specific IIC component